MIKAKRQILKNLTINKSITILKQILRLFDFQLKKREHVINKIKIIYYYLKRNLSSNILIENNTINCLVKFN